MIQLLANWILSFDILSGMGNSVAWGLSLFIVAALIFAFVAVNAIVLVYIERKVSAFMQVRLGPMRVGKFGTLQTVADALKLLQKEDIIPRSADKVLFIIGPWVILVASVVTFAAIPFSDTWLAANMNIGLFYVVSISSIVVLGIVMAGWASNNKWSLYGAMRSAAQIISYEIPVGITLIAVVAVVGSLNLQTIIQEQAGTGNLFHWIPIPLPNWFIFHSPFLFIAAFVYLIGATAEINRTPFDIPESESELVAGFMTEFSGLRWALFFLSEYANATLVAFLVSIVFLGGWQSPFADYQGTQIGFSIITLVAIMWTLFVRAKTGRLSVYPLGLSLVITISAWLFPGFAIWMASPGIFWMLMKAGSIIFMLMWFRWTFPRLRVDQLMYVSWKVILPLSLINLMGVAIWMWLTGEIQF
ncbi:MAG: NADH-quinone oxidoreductase subunit H [Candidatus Marinimicrobia bacterium]|jgi:NADH-quinone oxidoreductase subunit H|nr:NADH-quinone oxidoreductase subunit H [Candidatus Neomarinimicrobiota bacterium]MBT3576734.1 NADH-quinone oxidoreductase subunit H [Candidatus Neomarinimicrobiota bacterium]MBT3679106.1 NADH-quinone oxidoreductase subunit H [Candidatus Neomarinimicrobiota bacterium]MBT3951871.1 NADH-quinone oxidoreductase subunit H [Candidatus Neomarinimicrobiota bacterium]MBT4253839.1 NADH-quinone oxidoreductase subunit H [Candidatus Neomarinimicrobiota bacterium]